VPGTGKFIKLENNTYSVKTNDVIEDESGLDEEDRTVPTTQAVYNHTNNSTIHVTQEERDRWNRIGNLKAGIDIGTKDDSFDNDDDTTGFLKNVSKLNFKGAFVNVI
jgi:hypothetical protein